MALTAATYVEVWYTAQVSYWWLHNKVIDVDPDWKATVSHPSPAMSVLSAEGSSSLESLSIFLNNLLEM